MHFFGRQSDDVKAVDKVHQWLADTAESVPESLGDTSIVRLSKQASAELNMPQSTAVRALYDLRDSGEFVRVQGNNRSGHYKVKPVAYKSQVVGTVEPKKIAVKSTGKKIVVHDDKCAQSEPKVCVSKDGKTLNINITITIEA